MSIEHKRLEHLLAKFSDVRIAIVGDFFLDRYWQVDPALDEASIETGLAAWQVVETRCSPGAAGTVAANLAALGVGQIEAVGFVGNDGEGFELQNCFNRLGISRKYLQQTPLCVTPCYTKPMRNGVEMNRVDIKNRSATPTTIESRVIDSINELTDLSQPHCVDAVIIMDQVSEENCGVITENVRSRLIELGRERKHQRPLIYADSRERIGLFREMLIKCNDREALEQFGLYDEHKMAKVPREILQNCGWRLAQRTGRAVFITMGPQGQLLFDPEKQGASNTPEQNVRHVPAVSVEGEIDICGAGDSTSAALVASLCAGATLEEAALIGNLAASVTIRKIGQTGTASPDEILAAHKAALS